MRIVLKKLVLGVLEKLNSYANRYTWSNWVHSRKFDFSTVDKSKLKMVNIGASDLFRDKYWVSADFSPHFKTSPNENFPIGKKVHYDLMDKKKIFPFKNIDIFYSSHTFEHIPIVRAQEVLEDLYFALNKNGFVRVVVPDCDLILEAYRKNDRNFFDFMRSKFQEHEPTLEDYVFFLLRTGLCRYTLGEPNKNFDPKIYRDFQRKVEKKSNSQILKWFNSLPEHQDTRGTFHLTAFNYEITKSLLMNAGFSSVYRSAFMQSKSTILRESPKFDGTHPWMSLYVEARK